MNSLRIDRRALEMARRQFCLDIGMPWEEYTENPGQKVYIRKAVNRAGVVMSPTDGARKYEGRNDFFHAMICLGQLFLVVDEQIYDWARETFTDCLPEWFCEYGNLRRIDEKLKEYGHRIKDTHVYFLPEAWDGETGNTGESVQGMTAESNTGESPQGMNAECNIGESMQGMISECSGSRHEFLWYEQDEILYFQKKNRFTSAICFSKTQPDMLAVAALKEDTKTVCDDDGSNHKTENPVSGNADRNKPFEQDQMAGMAGVSADGAYLWQIGINVIPEEAGQGLAHQLVRKLKEEIIRRGKVPFYGTSESHTVSQTVGLKAGFVPAWTEVYAAPAEKN